MDRQLSWSKAYIVSALLHLVLFALLALGLMAVVQQQEQQVYVIDLTTSEFEQGSGHAGGGGSESLFPEPLKAEEVAKRVETVRQTIPSPVTTTETQAPTPTPEPHADAPPPLQPDTDRTSPHNTPTITVIRTHSLNTNSQLQKMMRTLLELSRSISPISATIRIQPFILNCGLQTARPQQTSPFLELKDTE